MIQPSFRLISLLFRQVGGWLEELELRLALHPGFGLGLGKRKKETISVCTDGGPSSQSLQASQ